MRLYIYDKGSLELLKTTDGMVIGRDCVKTKDGVLVLPESMEVSSKSDLSQALLSERAVLEPTDKERIELLEELIAEIMYGGESYAE